MARPAKSQWDFGELFPAEPPRQVLTVSQLTAQIRQALQARVGRVWVAGEITGLKRQASGHLYFSLKDAAAQLNCVLFRGELTVDRAVLADGVKVALEGEITVYEPRGQYQLRVLKAEPQGEGALRAAFEKLKEKLKAEGLFDPERKRPLPRFPRRIGLVTSPTGAAIRDVLHVIERRHPSLEIILAPCKVQGEGAAGEIAAAIQLLNRYQAGCRPPAGEGLDLILVTRGGGSLEDLWAFNEEVVARTVAASALPVVSAIGHEIDFTICDFAADLRAATPSAGAELITEGVFSSGSFVRQAGERLRLFVRQGLEARRDWLNQERRALARLEPGGRVREGWQRLDDLAADLNRGARRGWRERDLALQTLASRLSRLRPALILQRRREAANLAARRLREAAQNRLTLLRHRWASAEARLKLLGPEQVLARGYSITLDAGTGKVIRDADATRQGQELKTRLHRGELRSRIT